MEMDTADCTTGHILLDTVDLLPAVSMYRIQPILLSAVS